MTSTRKNVLVGITVLGALAAMGWMIVQFGGTLGGLAGGGGYQVTMTAPRVDGLSEGNRVQYRGMGVGRVISIDLDDSQAGFDVVIEVRDGSGIPANVRGVVRATNLISGGAAVDLELVGETAQGSLADLAGDKIPGAFGGAELLPPEIAQLAEEFRLLVSELREAGVVDQVTDVASRVEELTENLNALVGDESLRSDLRSAVASTRDAADAAAGAAREYQELGGRLNELETDVRAVVADFRRISADAREVLGTAGESVDTLSAQLDARLSEAETIFKNVGELTAKANSGEGTLGLLLNDPRAYEALNDDLLLLKEVLRDLERVVEQIEQEGVSVSIF